MKLFNRDTQDEFTERMVSDLGFLAARRLQDGTYVGITRLLYTLAICIGVDEAGWARRYCYDNAARCIGEYNDLEGGDDIPEGWIAQRPEAR